MTVNNPSVDVPLHPGRSVIIKGVAERRQKLKTFPGQTGEIPIFQKSRRARARPQRIVNNTSMAPLGPTTH